MGTRLKIGTYKFTCRFETRAILPAIKGSTFRGVFGHALRRIACVLKSQECEQCPLRHECLYALVFETHTAKAITKGSNMSDPPHPFVIEPPQTRKTEFQEGDEISCGLILFGELAEKLPYFVYAFHQMGEIGIGKRINGTRGKFELVRVSQGERIVYTKFDGTFKQGHGAPGLEFYNDSFTPVPGIKNTLEVRLETPLRLKFKNRLSRPDLPFHVLTRAMLRRISALFNTWGDGEPDFDYKGLVRRAQGIRTIDSDLKWFDWKRYSNRQETKMFMGGIVGNIIYEGALDEFLPLLEFCAQTHMGKATSFGLGKISIDFANNEL